MTPLEHAKKAMKEAAKEQGGTNDESGKGNPFKHCKDPGEYTGHKSAEYGGVAGKEVAGG